MDSAAPDDWLLEVEPLDLALSVPRELDPEADMVAVLPAELVVMDMEPDMVMELAAPETAREAIPLETVEKVWQLDEAGVEAAV